MQRRIRQLSWAAAAIGALLIVRSLPVETGLEALTRWVEGSGPLGPTVFGLAYLSAALLFIPGSVLTLASGAVFGLAMGTAIVSLASTGAAAFSFLIARHLARAKVEEVARGYPLFRERAGGRPRLKGITGDRLVADLVPGSSIGCPWWAIRAYLEENNAKPKPFIWTKTARSDPRVFRSLLPQNG